MDREPFPQRSDVLYKQGQIWRSWHRRKFTLKNGELGYYKIGEETRSGGIQLQPNWTVTLIREQSRDHCFSLKPADSYAKEYLLAAENEKKRDEWVSDLLKSIELLEARQERSKPTPPPSRRATPQETTTTTTTTAATNEMTVPGVRVTASTPQQQPASPPAVRRGPAAPPGQVVPAVPQPNPESPPPSIPREKQPFDGIELSPIQKQDLATDSGLNVTAQLGKDPNNTTTTTTTKQQTMLTKICVVFLLVLFLLVLVGFVVLSTSANDGGQTWTVTVECWESLKDWFVANYNSAHSWFDGLSHGMRVVLTVLTITTTTIIVAMALWCYKRNNKEEETTPFVELIEEGSRNDYTASLVCFYVSVVIVSLVAALLTTSALDPNQQIWLTFQREWESVFD